VGLGENECRERFQSDPEALSMGAYMQQRRSEATPRVASASCIRNLIVQLARTISVHAVRAKRT
jgi:hypothetical protein